MHQISDFLQMGANIQCNSYFPGYYASGNHNLIANDSKRKHNLSADHFEYYKEALKQTMLKQDTILRNQVQDLHRLYRRQRELMDEIRRNESEKHQQKMEASWLTTDLSRSSSVCVQKALHVPSLPLVNPACSQISVSVAESFQSPSCFVRGRDIQTCSYPTQTEGRSGDSELLESKCNKFRKNFLDLELPADAYIDDEGEGSLVDGKVSEAPEVSSSHLIRFPEAVCNGDAKQFLGTDGYSSVSEDDMSTTASLEKGSVDLNYLHKLEKGTSPTSGLQFLSKEYIQDTWKRQDFEVCSNVLLQERKRKQELPSTDDTEKRKRTLNSFPPGSHADKLYPSSSLLHEELKAAEPPTLHQNNQNSWSGRTIFGLQNPRSYSQSGPSGASSMCMPYEHIPQGKMENSGASCNAAIRKPVHDFARFPMAVQALPSFNTPVPSGNCSKSSTVRPGINGDMLQFKNDLRSSTKHGSAFFLDDNFSNGSQLESKNSEPHISFDNLIWTSDNLVIELPGVQKDVMDSANVKSRKDINLNCVPTGCSLDAAVSQCFQATTGSEKLEASSESLPWHRRKHNGKTDKGCEDSTQVEASDFSSKIIRESTGHPSNSILNPPEEVKKRRKAVVFDLNADCDSVLDAEIELTGQVVENEFDRKDFGFQIALNSSTTGDKFSPADSLSTGILLEAPASPENKECSPPRGESDVNQVETPFLLQGQDDPENNDFSPPIIQFDENQVVRTAAESLVSISSSELRSCIVRTTDKPLKTSCASLCWFAGIASSVVGGQENEGRVVISEELLPDGMDYFEVMTLSLTETKVEECCCCCCRSNGHKKEETGTTSLPNQPRKGRKRGRQRKDFQSEILPNLASLSRHEVTEDLQTIEKLIESSGTTRSVRCATKPGLARGRKRSSISPSTVTESSLESLIGAKSQVGKEERSLICWGEVTRRRRGQRYPVSKPWLISGQAWQERR
ncbi:uncharacterized protein LOC103931092 [Pyrus x bretschneideri]|uniref:uncharacterized protein LOC103931092 n=1 Tax=Pyrus x bretschneideri TaxID=225117 RepID=UPI00202EC266|nr:uncharacterized protein LOC103931092 [Pyrus x bretschneideri]XP_048443942.1 uncharacterized protein LOC103931092 [Pyrus x bretschneideri]